VPGNLALERRATCQRHHGTARLAVSVRVLPRGDRRQRRGSSLDADSDIRPEFPPGRKRRTHAFRWTALEEIATERSPAPAAHCTGGPLEVPDLEKDLYSPRECSSDVSRCEVQCEVHKLALHKYPIVQQLTASDAPWSEMSSKAIVAIRSQADRPTAGTARPNRFTARIRQHPAHPLPQSICGPKPERTFMTEPPRIESPSAPPPNPSLILTAINPHIRVIPVHVALVNEDRHGVPTKGEALLEMQPDALAQRANGGRLETGQRQLFFPAATIRNPHLGCSGRCFLLSRLSASLQLSGENCPPASRR